MASPIKPERRGEWLSKFQLAAALAVSESYFDRAIRPFAEPEDIRRDGRRLLFRVRPIVERWLGAKHRQADPLDLDSLLLGLDR